MTVNVFLSIDDRGCDILVVHYKNLGGKFPCDPDRLPRLDGPGI